MVELRIERKNRIATLYFIQGICIEKRGKIWVADVLLKEVRLRDNTKAVGIKLCARTIESMKKLTGTQILSTMLQIAQGLLTTVGNIARQLDIAWNKNAVGTAIILMLYK